MSLMSVWGMYRLTYPVVPEGPEALKLNSLLVELNANCVIVELEFKVNTFFSSSGVKAKATDLLAMLYVAAAVTVALIR